MSKQEDVLEGQVPAYGFEALVSVIEDDHALIASTQGGRQVFFYTQAAVRRTYGLDC